MNSAKLWPWALTGVLAVTVGGNAVVYYIANNDPSMVIEPDYYEKAVQWDSTAAEADRSRELGWKAQVRMGPTDAARGADIAVTLVDAGGQPVRGAIVHLTAIHNANASQLLGAILTEGVGGEYRGHVNTRRIGLWEIRLRAEKGPARFGLTVRENNQESGRHP